MGGVLRHRKFLLLLGILEDVCLYCNLLFPFVARSCNLTVTAGWAESWREVPLVGRVMAWTVLHLRFWGVTTIVVSCLPLMGLTGFVSIALSTEENLNEGKPAKDEKSHRRQDLLHPCQAGRGKLHALCSTSLLG